MMGEGEGTVPRVATIYSSKCNLHKNLWDIKKINK